MVKRNTIKLCMNCYVSSELPVCKNTEFMCKTCDIPLCPEKCYDMHRRNRLKMIND